MSLSHLLHTDGFVVLSEHPQLRSAVESATRRGRLHKLLPGVYAPDPDALSVAAKSMAVCAWDPEAVVTGDAALRLFLQHGRAGAAVDVATPAKHRPQRCYRFSCRRVPPELVVHGRRLRVVKPALAAIDLAVTDDGSAIDLVLRQRAATLAQLRAALAATPRRHGNARRAEVVLDSRDAPWSPAERRAHRILRGAGVGGWRANVPIEVARRTYYGDIVFARERVVLEVDGFEFHSTREAFELDRRRQNDLQLDGWLVLRVTWLMLEDEPEVVLDWVRRALAARA
ncbi:DUF559 domain-containing protein [Auraticoccus monumenti]|uniref:Very-short-patch-repair endonuclease n=1 Tax=Auraticoccus monumenti TaxID=675864 RepID=A0A1G6Z5V7_9ACTN|nr:DUF559 domain-containing protein [Auraticoccus monumenti]SDD97673.1 Very-short-patch-repair endonuclease [Auraticoccus monumenti]